MGVDALELLPLAGKPAGEVAPTGLAPGRHADGLDELAVGKKHRFLAAVLEAVGVVQIAGAVGQERRVGDIEHLALGVLEFLQRQRGLPAAGAADDDQRRRLAIDGLLRVIQGDRLVEQMNAGALGMKVAQRSRLPDGRLSATSGILLSSIAAPRRKRDRS